MFPEDIKEILYRIKEKTKNYNKHFLTFLLAYNGTSEMLKAIEKLSKDNPTVKPTPELVKNIYIPKIYP